MEASDKEESGSREVSRASSHPRFIFSLFGLVLSSYLLKPISNPSYFGHLTLGHFTQGASALPRENIWTILGGSRLWRNESWLFDYLLSVVESGFGDTGVAILTIILYAFVVLSAFFLFYRRAGDFLSATLIGALVCCGALETLSLQSQLFALGMFCFILFLRERLFSLWVMLLILVLTVVYANVHSTVLLALLLLGTAKAVGEQHSRLLMFGLAVPMLGFSPYLGGQVWQGLTAGWFEFEQALSYRHLSLSVFDFGFCFLLLLWILSAFLAASALRRRPTFEDILAGTLTLLSLAYSPLLPFALVLSGLTLCSFVRTQDASRPSPVLCVLSTLGARLGKLPLAGSVFLLLCLWFTCSARFFKTPVVDYALPRQALDYIQEVNLPGPVFHEREIAPYVVYRFSDSLGQPRRFAAFQASLDMIPATLRSSALALTDLAPGWEKVFVAVRPLTALCRTYTPLYEMLRRDPSWKLVFEADDSLEISPEQQLTHSPRPFSWAVLVKRAVAPTAEEASGGYAVTNSQF